MKQGFISLFKSPTAIGATAILMWASLASLTNFIGEVPPFQLTAMGIGLMTFLIFLKWIYFKQPIRPLLSYPPRVYLLGLVGIFGFHFFYFLAFQLAPVVEANILVYLWPLLVVTLPVLLLGERLRWWHAAGILLGLSGVIVLVGGGYSFQLKSEHIWGYASAIAAAICWALYSIFSRSLKQIPTDIVGIFCTQTTVLALICHLIFEQTVIPTLSQGMIILAIGLGPLGAAFFVWDHGVKKGDLRLLGIFAYSTPLLSTFLLILIGQATLTQAVLLACLLIVAGAVFGGADQLFLSSKKIDSES
jgi:drug/metabolite transporter (DMT)-like permease